MQTECICIKAADLGCLTTSVVCPLSQLQFYILCECTGLLQRDYERFTVEVGELVSGKRIIGLFQLIPCKNQPNVHFELALSLLSWIWA